MNNNTIIIISKLQKQTKFNIFKKYLISTYNNIFLHILTLNDFNICVEFINDKNIKSKVQSFLDKYYSFFPSTYKINSKQLLSSFMITKFNTHILNDNIESNDLYSLSLLLIESLKSITNYNCYYNNYIVIYFNKTLNKYKNCFDLWLSIDKTIKTNELLNRRHDVNLCIEQINNSIKYNDEEKQLCIKELDKNIDTIDKYYQIINGIQFSTFQKQTLYNFNKYYTPIVNNK